MHLGPPEQKALKDARPTRGAPRFPAALSPLQSEQPLPQTSSLSPNPLFFPPDSLHPAAAGRILPYPTPQWPHQGLGLGAPIPGAWQQFGTATAVPLAQWKPWHAQHPPQSSHGAETGLCRAKSSCPHPPPKARQLPDIPCPTPVPKSPLRFQRLGGGARCLSPSRTSPGTEIGLLRRGDVTSSSVTGTAASAAAPGADKAASPAGRDTPMGPEPAAAPAPPNPLSAAQPQALIKNKSFFK